jgi:hypothetical protein
MKFLFYLAIALVLFGIIKHVLKSKNEKGSGIKTSVQIDGKPHKLSKAYNPDEEEKRSLRVDPEGKNDGLNIATDEKVAWAGNMKIYKTPDGKWFIVYHRKKGELSYQRITPWGARNFIKGRVSGSDQDIEALLKKHNLTGTKDELDHKEVPSFVARNLVSNLD